MNILKYHQKPKKRTDPNQRPW